MGISTYLQSSSIAGIIPSSNLSIEGIFVSLYTACFWILFLGVFLTLFNALFKYTASAAVKAKDGKEDLLRIAKGLFIGLFALIFLRQYAPQVYDLSWLELTNRSPSSSSISSPPTQTIVPRSNQDQVGGVACAQASSLSVALNSGKGICELSTCQKAKCFLSPQIKTIIKEESVKSGVDWRYIASIACRESSGNPETIGRLSNNGLMDCGLMQINSVSCSADIMDVRKNVQLGITTFKSKISSLPSISSSYKNISKETMAFASYNCCGTEGNPNNQSVDCNPSSGFNSPVPKWVCPINPGISKFNMCAVRDYACDITTCANLFTE